MNPSNKKILPAFILCTCLGMFGAHRFYAGRTGSAIVMLILAITIIGLYVTLVWAFIDWIMILVGSFKDGNGAKIDQWV